MKMINFKENVIFYLPLKLCVDIVHDITRFTVNLMLCLCVFGMGLGKKDHLFSVCFTKSFSITINK